MGQRYHWKCPAFSPGKVYHNISLETRVTMHGDTSLLTYLLPSLISLSSVLFGPNLSLVPRLSALISQLTVAKSVSQHFTNTPTSSPPKFRPGCWRMKRLVTPDCAGLTGRGQCGVSLSLLSATPRTTRERMRSILHRITESQNGKCLKRPLGIIWSNPPAKAGSPRAGCTGHRPGGFGTSPQKETPQPPWAACSRAPSPSEGRSSSSCPGCCTPVSPCPGQQSCGLWEIWSQRSHFFPDLF